MRVREALISGIGAGVAMTLGTWLLERVSPCADMLMIWGTMLLPASYEAWLLGLIIHLIASAAVGVVYVWGFEHVTRHAGAWTGVVFSLAHSLFAGIGLGLLPTVHPRIPQAMPAPGWFALGYGAWGLLALVLVHASFGAFVGATYGTVLRASHGAPRRVGA